ncbi:MAG: Rnase Y domain-containing protein, partial [Candidatus Promineifilaceae bacterium]
MTQLLTGVLIGLLIGAVAAAIIFWLVLKPRTEAEYEKVEKEVAETRKAAEREAQTIIAGAQEEARATRNEAERVTNQRYKDLARAEERIDSRQSTLDKQAQKLENR